MLVQAVFEKNIYHFKTLPKGEKLCELLAF